MNIAMIPSSYEEWRHCITVVCKQPINAAFIDDRLKALNDSSDFMTKRFVELYGDAQRKRTIQWFEKAKAQL